jgi:hypothetical protein
LREAISTEENTMASQSSIHFFLNWTKERIDEMDATLAAIESKAAELRSESRSKADQVIADLRKKRDEFESTVKKQAEAGEAAWDATMKRLDAQWKGFETEVNNYLEGLGKDIKQQQAVFQSQFSAQMNAWRETADKTHAAAAEFAAERRKDLDAAVSRMKADAAAAQEKLQKLAGAGNESWSALNAALAASRTAFDRANQTARDAFERAASSGR